jgi:hypothetical protein
MSMKASLKYFTGGVFFLSLGIFARSLFSGAQPGPEFQSHPLGAGTSGIAVELLGWIGVFGYALIAVGLGLIFLNLWKGIDSGDIQAFVKEKMPKRKPAPVEGEEDPEGDGERKE